MLKGGGISLKKIILKNYNCSIGSMLAFCRVGYGRHRGSFFGYGEHDTIYVHMIFIIVGVMTKIELRRINAVSAELMLYRWPVMHESLCHVVSLAVLL